MFEVDIRRLYLRTLDSITAMEEEMRYMRKGIIIVRKKGNAEQRYVRYQGKETFIQKASEEEICQEIARYQMIKGQCEQMRKDLKKYERALKIIQVTPEQVIHEREIFQQEEERMLKKIHESYRKSLYSPFEENYQYPTMKGELVSSKSEMMIANTLFLKGIPYEYEKPIFLGTERMRPDFTLEYKGEMIWEHCGRMDDPEYVKNWQDRRMIYFQNGYYEGNNLIVTYEDARHPLTQETIDVVINDIMRK